MANIPGISGTIAPDVYSQVTTVSQAVALPGGVRLPAIIGLGARQETIILSALGGGQDGLNPTYTSTVGVDGRHFQLSFSNLVPRRSTVFLNSIPLTLIEEPIDTQPFDSRFQCRLDPTTGFIELQRAYIVNQAGSFYLPGSSNVGNGTLSTLNLINPDAPAETWTLRVTSVLRDAYGNPISGHAVFTIVGSTSGQINDAYGNPIVFVSDGVVRNNGILQVAIVEGSTPFSLGDRFTIIVSSQVLKKGDNLSATYIANADLYSPTFFTDPNALYQKHGNPSTSNTLSLAAQLAYNNGAFGIWALGAAPPLARQSTENPVPVDNPLSSDIGGFSGQTDVNSLSFPLINGVPDVNTPVQIIIVDVNTGHETEIFPNQVPYYQSTITLDPYNAFINNPSLYTYSYTVIMQAQVQQEGIDGAVVVGSNNFKAPSANFSAFNLDTGEEDIFKQIKILPYDALGNAVGDIAGVYDIVSVGGGVNDPTIVTLSDPSSGGVLPFTGTNNNLVWQLVDPANTGAYVLLTKDIVTSGALAKGDGVVIQYVDVHDATFFDSNWENAFQSLESVNCQIVTAFPNADYANIQSAGQAHVEAMSSTLLKQERLFFTGAQQGVTPAALQGTVTLPVDQNGLIIGQPGASTVSFGNLEDEVNFSIVQSFGGSFRVVYMYPDQITVVVNGVSATVDGLYMSAALAGFFAGSTDYAISATRKALTGFNINTNRTFSPTVINQILSVGVTLVVPVTGGGQVVWGLTTTDSDNALEQEISVVFIRDFVAQTMRKVMEGYIGQSADLTIVASITSTATKTLNGLVAQGVITDFANLSVSRDAVDPRQFDVSFTISPTLPINWIFINIGVTV